jgi:hypothetical protein
MQRSQSTRTLHLPGRWLGVRNPFRSLRPRARPPHKFNYTYPHPEDSLIPTGTFRPNGKPHSKFRYGGAFNHCTWLTISLALPKLSTIC